MGAFRHKPKSANAYQNTYYDKKTSEYGHYVPEVTGKRHGRDGSQAPITEMRWVEDNRQFSSPQQEQAPAPAAETSPVDTQLSNDVADASAYTDAYERKILPKQGDIAVGGDLDPVQGFKDAYQSKLTEVLKAEDPATLANKQAEIELKDKYSLDLGKGGLFS